jgi:glycerol uptake facilitator protein
LTPFTAELIGTALLITLGGGVVANVLLTGTKGNGSNWMVITTGWAMGVFVGVWLSAPYSGAHLNPAVSLALFWLNQISVTTLAQYVSAQMLGAALGAVLVFLFYRNHFLATQNPLAIRAVFCTDPAIRNWKNNLFSEFLGTFILVFVVLHFSGAELIGSTHNTPIGLGTIGALPVAFLVWAIGLSLGGTTGYAINPARDLAPRLIFAVLPLTNKAKPDWAYSWIPVMGPILGASAAAFLHQLLH